MILVTPANEQYSYRDQDLDEYQALLCDVVSSPRQYTLHADAQVRLHAFDTIDAYKLDRAKDLLRPASNAHIFLSRLHRRLREVAAGR